MLCSVTIGRTVGGYHMKDWTLGLVKMYPCFRKGGGIYLGWGERGWLWWAPHFIPSAICFLWNRLVCYLYEHDVFFDPEFEDAPQCCQCTKILAMNIDKKEKS